MVKPSHLIPNFLLLLSLAGVLHGVWVIWTHVGIAFDPWLALLLGGGALAMFLAVVVASRFRHKSQIALFAISTVVSFYIGNFVLELSGRNLLNIFEGKLVRQQQQPEQKEIRISVAQDAFVSPRPPTTIDPNDLQKSLAQSGISATYMFNPLPLLPLISNKSIPQFLPLSGKSNTVTLFCNEGDQREFPVIRTDRHGFNNDDVVYARPGRKILIIGDSFAQGSCVHQEQSVAGVLRRNGYPTISAGIGGFGPLQILASLKEYGEKYRPEHVLWFHFDGNDIVDLRDKGLRSELLLSYLDDNFSQNLAGRQDEVDAVWTDPQLGEKLGKYENDPAAKKAWQENSVKNLPLVRRLIGKESIVSLTDDYSVQQIFFHILKTAKRRVEAWGGKLHFVMVPNKDDYHGNVSKFRFPVMSGVRKLDIPIIDIDAAIQKAGDPLQFFPVRDQWGHFNAKGYRLFAQYVIGHLDGQFSRSEKIAEPQPEQSRTETVKTAELPANRHKSIKLEYKSYGQAAAVLPNDISRARASDGASVLGYTFTPSPGAKTLQLDLEFNAYSQTDNELVVAVFAAGNAKPLHLVSQPLSGGKRGHLRTRTAIPIAGIPAINFDIRIGPAKPGLLFINGDAGGKRDLGSFPHLTITELTTAPSLNGNDQRSDMGQPVLAAPLRWSRYWNQQFPGHIPIDRVMPKQQAANTGVRVLGFSFSPEKSTTAARIRVAVNAYAERENELVVRLNREGRGIVGVATTLLPPETSTFFDRTFELTGLKPTETLSVFVGPGKEGTIFLNGDGRGQRQSLGVLPTLTVEERLQDGSDGSTKPDFPDDDNSRTFAELLNIPIPGTEPRNGGRKTVSCESFFNSKNTAVFVAFGQSQAANTGSRKTNSTGPVANYNFFDSTCYPAMDPLLGASNHKGSVWPLVGDLLVKQNKYDKVVFAPVAVGGSFLSQWRPGGLLHKRLLLALQRLRKAGGKITGFLWAQGEAESGYSNFTPDEYKAGFLEMLASLRSLGYDAPVYVARTTHCSDVTDRNRINIRQAQQELAAEHDDIHPGPNTDQIGSDLRYDDCHFNEAGQVMASKLWADAIR